MNETSPSFIGRRRENILHFIRECVGDQPGSPDPPSDAAMKDLLEQYLDTTVIPSPQITEKFPAVFMHIYREINSRKGRSVGDYLLDASTSLLVLKEIKEHHREVAHTSRSQAERQVATAIYFAAIAAALVFRHEKITSYSNNEVGKAIDRLSIESWIPLEIRDLFTRATEDLSGQHTS